MSQTFADIQKEKFKFQVNIFEEVTISTRYIQILLDDKSNEEIIENAIHTLIHQFNLTLSFENFMKKVEKIRSSILIFEPTTKLMFISLLSKTLVTNQNLYLAMLNALEDGYDVLSLLCLACNGGVYYNDQVQEKIAKVYIDLLNYHYFDVDNLPLNEKYKNKIKESMSGRIIKPAIK